MAVIQSNVVSGSLIAELAKQRPNQKASHRMVTGFLIGSSVEEAFVQSR